jgi:TPP-dependent pyruvate/acetoin dehydrogenase alpha subunit
VTISIDLNDLAAEGLLLLDRNMLRIRRFEERVYQLFLQGLLPETLHQCQGQEAVAVGVCGALAPTDWITSTHRPHGHVLAKGLNMSAAMAELFGKATGCCGGKGGSMHLGHPSSGALPAIAIVAGGNSVVTGMGLAFKLRGTGQVAVCFFGEGATNEGAFHEGLNLAAVMDLPVVYVCENNLYGASTHYGRVSRVTDVAERASAYGVRSEIVDGMDVVAMRRATARAVAEARAGRGPVLIEAKTYRFSGHMRGDARGYRSREEEAVWQERDPIKRLRQSLLAAKIADARTFATVEDEVGREIEAAVEFARSSPDPDPADALVDVYATPIP